MLMFYFDQNWLEAQKKLKDCENLLNGVMKEYYNMMNLRLENYISTPPPRNWDGVYVATTK